MDIDFKIMEELFTDPRKAFEYLVCIIAQSECTKDYEYTKFGKNDRGCECILKHKKNNEVIGFQAKFFHQLKANDKDKWSQIRASIEAAKKEYKDKLIEYRIFMPADLSHTSSSENTALNEWRKLKDDFPFIKHVDGLMIIDFISSKKHLHLKETFLGKKVLTEDWFQEKLDLVLNQTKHGLFEYTYNLDYQKYFDHLLNYEEYFLSELKKCLQMIRVPGQIMVRSNNVYSLSMYNNPYESIYSRFRKLEEFKLPGKLNDRYLKELLLQARILETEIHEFNDIEPSAHHISLEPLSNLINLLENHKNISLDPLIFEGEAGFGKTHLFCKTAKDLSDQGHPVVLALGHTIDANHPFKSIVDNLELSNKEWSSEDFLCAIDAYAYVCGKKALIMIDAINDSSNKLQWKKQIEVIHDYQNRYKNLAFALSVRTSFTPYLLPKAEVSKTIKLLGFKGKTKEAVSAILNECGISANIPIDRLNPEFDNPLFVWIFVQVYKDKSQEKINSALTTGLSITEIIDEYIRSVEIKMFEKQQDEYDIVREPLKQFCKKLAQKMLLQNPPNDSLLDEVVTETISRLFGNKTKITDFISENLLKCEEVKGHKRIRFNYQRISDVFMAKAFCNQLSENTQKNEHSDNQLYRKIIENAYNLAGLISVLMYIYPLNFNSEFVSLLEQYCGDLETDYYIDMFFDSFIWRDRATLTDETKSYLDKFIQSHPEIAFRKLISHALYSAIPTNADYLYGKLYSMSMAQRDHDWTITINNMYLYNEKEMIDIYLDMPYKNQLDKDNVLNWSTLITWFLTASNRELRDKSTLSLVKGLTSFPDIIPGLLKRFENVNDMYVQERLYAVAYGVLMRSKNTDTAKIIVSTVYGLMNKNPLLTKHLLLADYVENIIDYGNKKLGLNNTFEVKSDFVLPLIHWKLDNLCEMYDKMKSDQYLFLNGSLFGDFNKYVIGESVNDIFRRVSSIPAFDYNGQIIEDLQEHYPSWFIFSKVLEYGWTPELFEQYDRKMALKDNDNPVKKVERIGKKYQWIALYELLGMFFDFSRSKECPKVESDTIEEILKSRRDIDPSVVLDDVNKTPAEFNPHSNYNLYEKSQYNDWVIDESDNNDFERILTNKDYVTLAFFHYEYPQEKTADIQRSMQIIVRSLFCKSSRKDDYLKQHMVVDRDPTFEEVSDRNIDMPHYNINETFLGEFYWSKQFHYRIDNQNKEFGYPVDENLLPGFYNYNNDYRYTTTNLDAGYYMPPEHLVKALDLSFNYESFCFVDPSNNPVCFIRCVGFGKEALFISGSALAKYLENSDLVLIHRCHVHKWGQKTNNDRLPHQYTKKFFITDASCTRTTDIDLVYSPAKKVEKD